MFKIDMFLVFISISLAVLRRILSVGWHFDVQGNGNNDFIFSDE